MNYPWNKGEKVDLRIPYGEALVALGKVNDKIVVLDADLQRSNRTFDFSQIFPDRFFDLGISEADLISTACGLASTGLVPFANSFAMFLPGRCYDQIRLQAAYANNNVKLVGSSAGITIGPDGASHQALDDIGLMRILPNMTVIVPADAIETCQAVLQAADHQGPVYIRISRYPGNVIYDNNYHFEIGKPDLLVEGEEILLCATGIMVDKAINAAKELQSHGHSASVMNISTIKPLPEKAILSECMGKKLVVSIEEHSIIGGLGSAIAEVLSERTSAPPLLRLGVNDCFGQSGTAEELLDFYGLTPGKLSLSILRILNP